VPKGPNPGGRFVVGGAPVVILAMFALPVVAVVLYLRGLHSRPPTAMAERDPAMDVLRQRLATGDIDEVEYKRLSSALQGH
jgi:uncharacterized membrane protein